jgi:hypothetical protein
MRRSYFLHLALGLLSWSSQLAGASTEPQKFPNPRSSHQLRLEMRSLSLPSASMRKVSKTADTER